MTTAISAAVASSTASTSSSLLANQYRTVCLRTPTSVAISSSDTASTPRVPKRLGGDGEDAVAGARRDRRHSGLSSTRQGRAMAAEIRPVDASRRRPALDAVVALIAGQQVQRDRHVVYVGEQADGIRAELDDVQPRWTDTLASSAGRRPDALHARRVGRCPSGGRRSSGRGSTATTRRGTAGLGRSSTPCSPSCRRRSRPTSCPAASTTSASGTLAAELGWPESRASTSRTCSRAAAVRRRARRADDDGLRGVVPTTSA